MARKSEWPPRQPVNTAERDARIAAEQAAVQARLVRENVIDQAAVDRWVADAKAATPAERTAMTMKLRSAVQRGYNPFGNDRTNLVTLAAIANAIASIDELA